MLTNVLRALSYELFFEIFYRKLIKQFVRTNFDLNPEQEWTQAQKARIINL